MASGAIIGQQDQQDDQRFSALAMLLAGAGMKARAEAANIPAAEPGPTAPASSQSAVPTAVVPTAPAPTAAVAAPVATAPATTFQPPTPPNLDPQLKRYQDLQAKINAPAPNPSDYQPHGWRKFLSVLAQGAATFGSGMTHNPVFAETAQANLERPYKQAMEKFGADRQQNQQGLEALNQEIGGIRNDYQDRMNYFNAQVHGAQSDALNREREAKADKYSNAIDPRSFREDPTSKTGYKARTYGGEEVEAEPPNAFKKAKDPMTYEATVIAANLEKDPARKAALMAAAEQMQKAEVRKFSAGAPRGEKRNEYEDWHDAFKRDNGREPSAEEITNRKSKAAGTFKTSADVDKYSDQWYLKQRDEVEKDKQRAQKMNPDASPNELQAKYKEIEEQYKQRSDEFERRKKGYYDALKGGKRISVDDDGNVLQAAQTGKAQPSQPDSKPQVGAPPSSLFKGEGQTLKLRNKATGKTETWQMKGGSPIKVGG